MIDLKVAGIPADRDADCANLIAGLDAIFDRSERRHVGRAGTGREFRPAGSRLVPSRDSANRKKTEILDNPSWELAEHHDILLQA